jgi:hypothetical protein
MLRRGEVKRYLLGSMAVLVLILCSLCPSQAVVLNFDALSPTMTLTNSSYGGLTWEAGNPGGFGNQGYWLVDANGFPHSGRHYAINAWGCSLLGIGFQGLVNVNGAYFAQQGAYYHTTGVRVHGYRFGTEVEVTDWFTDIDTHSDWFAMNLYNVDRIVVEAIPVYQGGGGYEMDDFTYEPVPEPSSLLLLGSGALCLLGRRRFHIRPRAQGDVVVVDGL